MMPEAAGDGGHPGPNQPDHTMAMGTVAIASGAPIPLAPEVHEEQAGESVGPFRLVERLGRGTFGSVWRAVRTEPFDQEVAVKIMRKDVASAEGPAATQARFDLERQVLAELDHPGIARVFDGGISEKGRNFFVMELVRGVPITQFCDANRLSIRDRLELFIQVCEAVHYAHQHGVLHRDLKPGNILAFQVEGERALGSSAFKAKVIDFGLAKVTLRASSVRHQFVERGLALGTPEYMSPEQAAGDVGVDGRSDIYGLGAVLYELLVGAAPFDAKSLRSRGLEAMVKVLRESDPPSPSDRLSSLASVAEPALRSSVTDLCRARGLDPRRLLDLLRRELNLLPMKAMRRNPADRYRSAVEMADDVRNYLDGRPLIAAPPSAVYRARKFVRRHWGAVLATAAVAASLVAATVLSTWFGMAEARARRLAEQRERQTREVARFQQDMLAQVDPRLAGIDLLRSLERRLDEGLRDRGVPEAERAVAVERLRQDLVDVNPTDAAADFMDQVILRPAAGTADRQFGDQPLVRAGLQQALARTYFALGLAEQAWPLQESALGIREQVLGGEHRDTLEATAWAGRIRLDLQDLEGAERYLVAAKDARERLFGRTDPDTRDSLRSMVNLEASRKRWEPAIAISRELLAGSSAGSAEERWRTSASLGTLLLNQGDPREAVRVLQPVQAALATERNPDPRLSMLVLNNLAHAQKVAAQTLERTGDSGADPMWQAAERTYGSLLRAASSELGDEHPDTLRYRNNLAMLLIDRKRGGEAAELLAVSVSQSTRARGGDDLATLRLRNALAIAKEAGGDLPGACDEIRSVESVCALRYGADAEATMAFRETAANMLEKAGDLPSAESRFRAIWTAQQARVASGGAPPEDPRVIDAATNLARVLTRLGRHAEAEAVLMPAATAALRRKPDSEALWNSTQQLLATCKAWAEAQPSDAVAQSKLSEATARERKVRADREAFLAKTAAPRP
ncbi:MAG: hypothetical protein EBQ99_02765 [Planctomycetes bacterium]|nr:hypothetical protein [Planctomycetota bacterium]